MSRTQDTINRLIVALPLRVILSYPFQWLLSRTYYRFYCPGSDGRARDCVRSGQCGCDNAARYSIGAPPLF